MHTWEMKVTLLAAFIVAGILLRLGLSRKKTGIKGLFGLGLVFFMSTGAVPAVWGLKKKVPDFRKEFNGRSRWNQLRTFWKKLDAIEPNRQGTYMGTVPWEEIEALRREAESIFGYPVHELHTKDVSEFEIVLYRLIHERIEGFGIPRHMMTRMMPPPSLTYKYDLVHQMELDIDVLLELRKQEKVSDVELQNVWKRISKQATIFGVLSIIEQSYGIRAHFHPVDITARDPKSPMETKTIIDTWVEGLDMNYKKSMLYYEEKISVETNQSQIRDMKDYQKQLTQNYKQAKENLRQIKGKEHHFSLMIRELEK